MNNRSTDSNDVWIGMTHDKEPIPGVPEEASNRFKLHFEDGTNVMAFPNNTYNHFWAGSPNNWEPDGHSARGEALCIALHFPENPGDPMVLWDTNCNDNSVSFANFYLKR